MKVSTVMTELEQFRAQKDAFFKTHPHSPLTPEQQATFTSLRYFPENPELRLVLPLEAFAEQDTIVMQTSTGDERVYTRSGRLRFTVDGQDVALTLYADADSGTFFLPFVDALRGRETYGAGRYLDPEPLEDGQFLIDFNLAYNPTVPTTMTGPARSRQSKTGSRCPFTQVKSCLTKPITSRLGSLTLREQGQAHSACPCSRNSDTRIVVTAFRDRWV
jgi:uncharacterized protein